MLTRIFENYCQLPRWMRTPLWRLLHAYLDAKDRQNQITFLNYGFASLGEEGDTLSLLSSDEWDRYSIQLYHQVASRIDVTGLNLVEVGCGRGGGASYIARYLHPKSFLGIDQSVSSTNFCNGRHLANGLSFIVGDAEALPLEDSSVDALVNVESSRCYRHIDAFFSEVHRVLKPNGHLLFADLRDVHLMPLLREQISRAGFEYVDQENITANVAKALEMDHGNRTEVIRKNIPRALIHLFDDIAGVQGSERFEALSSGAMEYWSYTLRRVS